jgi:hypothetical protein
MAVPVELVGRYGSKFDRQVIRGKEPGSAISSLRVIMWLAWLTACTWLTRYNRDSGEQGT